MNNRVVTYLGKEYSYPLLTAEEVGNDRVVNLANYEFWVQGYVFCYTETRRFHFLIAKQEFAKIDFGNKNRLEHFGVEE